MWSARRETAGAPVGLRGLRVAPGDDYWSWHHDFGRRLPGAPMAPLGDARIAFAVGAVVGVGVGATAVVDVPEELGAGEGLAASTGADVAQNRTAASGRASASLSSEAS